MNQQKATAQALLHHHPHTYAEQAGIHLTDHPAALYQLLVLATLLSTRIRAHTAVNTAHELFTAGMRTPQRMANATWQDRVNALGRGHYRRYDERTATMLGTSAQLCLDRWHGDLRRLHTTAGSDPDQLRHLLTEFPGIGPTGADIFLREAQTVWPDIRPYVDQRARTGANRLGLPTNPHELAALVPSDDIGRLTSALVRVALGEPPAAEAITHAVVAGHHR